MPRRPRKPDSPPPKRRARNSGSVGRRSADGRFFAILPKDLDPKRRPVYSAVRGHPFASEAEAEAWLEREVARRRDPSPRAAALNEPLGAYLARWYRLYSPGWPVRTRSSYLAAIRRYGSIGHVPLGGLTHEAIQSVIAAMQTATWQRRRKDGTPIGTPRPYSPRTILQTRNVLHQALEQLVPHVLTYNPARRTRIGRFLAPEQPVWSAEQAALFLETAERVEPRLALAFRLILRRALRRGEVLALRWTDIDERRSVLTVDETVGRRVGETGPTKTRRVRQVPLSPELLERLRAHRRAYPSTSPFVFTLAGRSWPLTSWDTAVGRVLRAARVPHATPKDWRATCATILLDEGVPLPTVARLLGHADVATTARFYARAIERRATAVGAELDRALDRAAESGADSEPDATVTLHSAGLTR